VRPARSPHKSPRSPSTGRDSDSEPDLLDDEEGDHLVFQPVVPLPDKVPVSTGEEEEEILYSQRAKLYRFSAGEWKERGIGDIKILRHNNTHKIRILMRREPILKLCLNHLLTAEMTLAAKDDRSWLWSAADFADGQLQNEQFCVRFKTPDVAGQFKAAFDSAKTKLEGAEGGAAGDTAALPPTPAPGGEADDVEIVYEVSVSEELRQAALRLQLPPNFYNYLNAPPCPGCPGCDHSQEEDTLEPLSTVPTTKSSAVTTSTATVASAPVTATTTTALSSASTTSSSQEFSFKFNPTPFATQTIAASSQPFSFLVKTTESSWSGASAAVSTPSLAVTQPFSFSVKSTAVPTSTPATSATPATVAQPTMAATTAPSRFSFTLNTDSVATTTSGSSASAFGSTFQTTNSFFGGSPLMQTTTANKRLLFGSTSSTQSTATPSFGNSQASSPSIFGGSALNQSSKTTPVFNASFGALAGTAQSPASVFGTPKSSCDNSGGSSFFQNLTSFETPQKSLFGGLSPQSSASFSDSASQPASTESGPTFLYKDSTSFSDIASKSKQTAFESASSNFTWAGTGTPVFKGKEVKGDSDEEGESEGEADCSHDPVFEPVVPLPEAIEVRTGEEDEDREFCERAKFYLYNTDTKEWKERGIGEMKILKHKKANTYRLLLRREQVHKVVCNQLILPGLELQPLSGSVSAFCWFAYNLAEEYPEPQLEKVAVRFKNSDIARNFKDTLERCIAEVAEMKHNANTSVEESASEYSVLEPETNLEEREDSDYDYQDEDPLFDKRAKVYVSSGSGGWTCVGQGDLQVLYTGVASVVFKPDHAHPIDIHADTNCNVQKVGEKEVSWFGQDYETSAEEMQKYKAEFASSQAAEEFTGTLQEAVDLAHAVGCETDEED